MKKLLFACCFVLLLASCGSSQSENYNFLKTRFPNSEIYTEYSSSFYVRHPNGSVEYYYFSSNRANPTISEQKAVFPPNK